MRSRSLPLASAVSISSISRIPAKVSRLALGLCLLFGSVAAGAQSTTFPDPVVPVALVPSAFNSQVYVLNQDRTLNEYEMCIRDR